MATTAKKFVKVTGLSQVFATSSATGNWHGYDISQIKSGVTMADNNSILFILDDEWGKWIWAQGRMYSGNDFSDFEIGTTGDDWIGTTTSRDEAGNLDITITHKGATAGSTSGATTAVADGSSYKFNALTKVESDSKGHVTNVETTEITVPVTGVTGDAKVQVGISGTQYYITHASGVTGVFTAGKTATNNEVTVTNPVLTFDNTGHLVEAGSTSYKITAADLGVDGVLHFLGVTTTDPSVDPDDPHIVIGEETVTAKKGDIVLYGTKEYVWSGEEWKELGDETKYLLGATGDDWIGTQIRNGVVYISHKAGNTGTQKVTGGVINEITYDDKGHVVGVGTTGTRSLSLGVTGATTAGTARIRMISDGTDIGTADIVGASGIEVKVITAGTNAGKIQISQNDKVYANGGVTGSTYKVADLYIAGATTAIYGKDTTYTVGGTAVTGDTGANIIVGATSSTGVYTGATIPIVSADDSIAISASAGKVVIDYTGVSTPDDWAVIPTEA